MVTSGTVSVTVTVQGKPLLRSASVTVQPRSGFTFSAASPTQVLTNSLTCYNGQTTDLLSPPNSTSFKGASCPDLAFGFTDAKVQDSGPNNGYWYVATARDSTGTCPGTSCVPTKYEYAVVSDLLSPTTFYSAQCGTYSATNTSGLIAAVQLKQNAFDHEQGPVLSHWTEYVSTQNNSANNVGIVLESTTGAPSLSQSAFDQTATSVGNSAVGRIVAGGAPEPCSDKLEEDSSQACKFCGAINYSPYQSCGSATPVAYCQ
jgi:hypothetical protein